MRVCCILVVAGLLGWSGASLAAGDDTPPAATASPELVQAQGMVKAKRYTDAIPMLQSVIRAAPDNADALNLLGYSLRKTKDFGAAETAYNRALAADPKHLGALEYLGELYLETQRPEEAESILRRLDDICLFGCEEYDELKEAVAAFRAKGG